MTRLLLAAIILPFNPPFAIAVVCAAIGGLLVGWAVRELARPVADDVPAMIAERSRQWEIAEALLKVEQELFPWARAGCPTAEVVWLDDRRAA